MTTIPSIDSMTTMPCASAADATPVPGTPTVTVDLTALPHSALAEEQPPIGGLAELVADNAALGETLQSLVDAMDKPVGEQPVFVGKTVGLPTVKVKPEEVVVGNLLPEARTETVVVVERSAVPPTVVVEAPVVAEQPIVRGEPGVFALPQPAVTVEGGSQPPRVTDASVVEDKPLEDKTVVLQATPVVSAPSGDSVVPVREATDGTVSAVTRAAPIDFSPMFLAAAEEVAAAVTVSPELMRGEAGEIRVRLRPDVLEGTEVVVTVDGKKMDVTFVPAVTHVADTVAANQPLVQQQLAAKLAGFEISVAVAQTVATNVSVGVASSASAQAAVARARRTNGRA